MADMERVPDVGRESLSAEGQAAWDAIAGSRGGVSGPYRVLIQVPALAERVAHLGTYLRFEGLLAGAERELAILVVAQHVGARFEWSAHESIARREGTRPEAIEVVRAGAPTDPLTEPERLIVETARALLQRHTLTDAEFARARDALGQARLVELVGLVGYYTMIAFVLVAFGVEPT
jgi:4-carboxymuconolactone decarboxylase